MSKAIALARYSTSSFRRIIKSGFLPATILATQVQGALGALYMRTEETDSGNVTTDITGGVSAANIFDALLFGGFQAGSSMADLTEALLFDNFDGVISIVEYEGDGTASQQIGAGFEPEVVLVVRPGTAKVYIKTLNHSGANARDLSDDTGQNDANAILTLQNADVDLPGFTVGDDVNLNTNAIDYVALCMRQTAKIDEDDESAMSVVAYTGDGNSARSITGAGFRPDAVIIVRSDTDVTSQVAGLKMRGMLDGEALDINTGTKITTPTIDTLDDDGFTFAGTGKWNVLNAEYDAIFLKAGLLV